MAVKKNLEKNGEFKCFEEFILKEYRRQKTELKRDLQIELERDSSSQNLVNSEKISGQNQESNSKTKRIRKNKYLTLLQNRKLLIVEKLKKGVLTKDSYWFLKFKKIRPNKKKIIWNLTKKNKSSYQLKYVSLIN